VAVIYVEHPFTQSADTVWQRIRDFSDLDWLPGVTGCHVEGNGVGAVRTVTTADGGQVVEALTAMDEQARAFGYRIIQAPGVREDTHYQATVEVQPTDSGCKVIWQAQFNGGNASADKVELARRGAEKMYLLCLENLARLLK
jgi:carbon monoxide dehydrogenase subunit G